jgi:hypothetical protein
MYVDVAPGCAGETPRERQAEASAVATVADIGASPPRLEYVP